MQAAQRRWPRRAAASRLTIACVSRTASRERLVTTYTNFILNW
jgi:hypothetical protein